MGDLVRTVKIHWRSLKAGDRFFMSGGSPRPDVAAKTVLSVRPEVGGQKTVTFEEPTLNGLRRERTLTLHKLQNVRKIVE